MAGINFGAVLAGLGQAAQNYQASQDAQAQRRIRQMQIQQYLNEQKSSKDFLALVSRLGSGSPSGPAEASGLAGLGGGSASPFGAGDSSADGYMVGMTDPTLQTGFAQPVGQPGDINGLAALGGGDIPFPINLSDTTMPQPSFGGGRAASPQFSPSPGGGFSSGLQALTSLGVAPDVASGAIDYMFKNESGSDPLALNPTSGALARAQWLGPRKTALTSEFGPQPSDPQQADFMKQELQGPERGTLDALLAASRGGGGARAGYDIWGKDYERPGDAALAKAGVGGTGAITPQMHAAATQTAQTAAQDIDPFLYGRMSIQALAKKIDAVDPDGDPVVKAMALERAAKLLAPDQSAMFRVFMMQAQQAQQRDMEALRQQNREDLTRLRSEQGGQIIETDQGPMRVSPGSNTASPIDIGGAKVVGRGGDKAAKSENWIVTDKEGGEVFRGAAHESPSGGLVGVDGKPIPIPEGGRAERAGAASGGGGRAGAQVLRQQIGAREVLSDLQNAMSMPVGETTGILGQYQPGTTLMGALRGDTARKLTSQDAQLMQASFASLSRELSILMSPVYGGNWAAQQIDPLIPKEGDTVGTTLFKMARIAQSADNALEAVEKSPILSNDQKKFASDMRSQIGQAVPWSAAEALSFARGGTKKDESFQDFMKKRPGGQEPGAIPVPPELKSAPDGTTVRNKKTGELRVKQGDKLIPAPAGAVDVPADQGPPT